MGKDKERVKKIQDYRSQPSSQRLTIMWKDRSWLHTASLCC